MELMFVSAPVCDIHSGDEQSLGTLAGKIVGHTRIAEVITNTDGEFPPRRLPQLAFARGHSVLKELNGNILCLLEYDLAGGPNYESRVVKGARIDNFLPT